MPRDKGKDNKMKWKERHSHQRKKNHQKEQNGKVKNVKYHILHFKLTGWVRKQNADNRGNSQWSQW